MIDNIPMVQFPMYLNYNDNAYLVILYNINIIIRYKES
jgi:hypothetical protein